MKYNIYIKTFFCSYSILAIEEDRLKKVIEKYEIGEKEFFLSGKKYSLHRLFELQIFTSPPSLSEEQLIVEVDKKVKIPTNFGGEKFFDKEILIQIGKNVTSQFIGDKGYGSKKIMVEKKKISEQKTLINIDRIQELETIKSKDFDLTRLIQNCKEINDNFNRENYLSVIANSRALIDHIPPIFGFRTFNEVANNYGNKSFKKNMNHLNSSMRSIADGYLHSTIRRKENLPNNTQINFSQDIDVLLAEIIRKMQE